ncbi:MAG: ribosome biogenesis GTPase Der [Pseudomonadota bacterium]|nr:ribosome biogenesis GTPase Der [Pseudomonadota bacterium]
MSLTVAIVGRPNVGKSTLFNRLVGRRAALVHPEPGVTRDRREGEGRLGGLELTLIDTAGLEDAPGGSMEARMREQTERALSDADVALLVIDARIGLTPMDRHFTDWIRKSPTPVILVANKCEGGGGRSGQLEAYELGLGDPVGISAEHGEGLSDLFDALAEHATDADYESDDSGAGGTVQLAIIGRPNVGKSTLVNRLIGEERVITGPEPGVTRDAIAIQWKWGGHDIRLIDTAGMRRRSRVAQPLEKLSVADTLRAIRFAHVVVLLVDGEAIGERQDFTIAKQVIDEGRAMVIAVNKWDIVKDRDSVLRQLFDRLERSLPQVRGIPVVPLSALTGAGTDKLLPAVFKGYETWNRRIPTSELNKWLAAVLERHPPPLVQGKRLRIRYMTQPKARPPTFAVFASRSDSLPESYLRYLANGLRDSFDLSGVPIRINPRKGKNPYAPK